MAVMLDVVLALHKHIEAIVELGLEQYVGYCHGIGLSR